MNEDSKTTYEWNKLPWRKLERSVYKLQKRIYRASSRGDIKRVHRLQKLLMKSWSAKCLAVRRVTQDNQGAIPAGVDGLKNLSPKARLILIQSLKLNRKAAPTRKVYIHKPGTKEKRPLGIHTIYDLALQALVKLALEPEWEALFEPNSFGFRSGRSCHDAIQAIYGAVSQKAKYVLDADIAKCFEKINHDALLRKLNTSPTIRRQVKAWLKSGVMKAYGDRRKTYFQYEMTTEGTPPGCVISPLLANVALHGMEYWIEEQCLTRQRRIKGKQVRIPLPILIRYLDDFVVVHEDITVVQRCQQLIAEWLGDMGLELKTSKTRISHTLHKYERNVGFNFLGFTIRQFPAVKGKCDKDNQGRPLGFKTIIKPSKESLKTHLAELGKTLDECRAMEQGKVIGILNTKIKVWSNYFRTQCSKEIFSKADHLLYQQLRAWTKRRHPRKGRKWVKRKYWRTAEQRLWSFSNGENTLIRHSDTKIVRQTGRVKGEKNPFDADWVYWSKRMRFHPEVSTKVARLMKEQKGKCTRCGLKTDSRFDRRYLDRETRLIPEE